MKNVFGYPYSKTEDMPCDGARFITNRADAALKRKLTMFSAKRLRPAARQACPVGFRR